MNMYHANLSAIKQKLLQALDQLAAELLDKAAAKQLSAFQRALFSLLPDSELIEQDSRDLHVAALSSWQLLRTKSPGGSHNPNPVIEVFRWHSESGYNQHNRLQILHPDMPFVTDSVILELQRHSLTVHQLYNLQVYTIRDADGRLQEYRLKHDDGFQPEVLIHAEVDLLDVEEIEDLVANLHRVLRDVRSAVADFPAMQTKARALIARLQKLPPGQNDLDRREAIAFLEWILQDNFTFLGCYDLEIVPADGDRVLRRVAGSELGVLKNHKVTPPIRLTRMRPETRSFLTERRIVQFSKSGSPSLVHRPAYPDYIGIKRFDEHGEVCGEDGLLGLFTSPVYSDRPENIPVIRHRVAYVIRRSGLDPKAFNGKALHQVLATFPREELFQASDNELFSWAMIATFNEKRQLAQAFLRRGERGLFYSCLVYTPRDIYTTRLRLKMEQILIQNLRALDCRFHSFFSESALIHTYFVLRLDPDAEPIASNEDILAKIRAVARNWHQELARLLNVKFGDIRGRYLRRRYENAFPASYQESEQPPMAVYDIERMEKLTAEQDIVMRLYHSGADEDWGLKLKILRVGPPLPLADILEILENLGLRVAEGTPHRISRADGTALTIQDLRVSCDYHLDLRAIGDLFTETFRRIWYGDAENDLYNSLTLVIGADWRQIAMMRAYGHYIKQIRSGYSQQFIASTLLKHATVTKLLIDYFYLRLNPVHGHEDESARTAILHAIDDIEALNEDRIMRRYLELMDATLRTNYFQQDPSGELGGCISFKIAGKGVTNMPAPVMPMEIFVYSPTMEGIHLRGGPIARGGLRWSDRLEDFRTEILGLVKAQQVKNSIITPVGAKGGFVVKASADDLAPEEFRRLGIEAYRQFIQALLDITDNIIGKEIQRPAQVRCYDAPDSYLAVAADKGTATFSDTANDLALERGYWMGDAFASGGSHGYDHKKLGITARGAWVSVRHHLRELSMDPRQTPITALGIGDMSGDVFGNGMLAADPVLLVAAFNHKHIFLDPNPDVAIALAERKRLFALRRSSWADYDNSLLSPGGGIFSRRVKAIRLSPEARRRFHIAEKTLAPDALIRALLSAPVDMIWNGGIGTYVRSDLETDQDVGDKSNDGVRIPASKLRCRIFAEGGNLGLTQAARVQFALAGGMLNTDFVDNSAGVNCSDYEVNIKILLDNAIARGKLDVKERDGLLDSLAEDVAELSLVNNFRQARAISMAQRHSGTRPSEYLRLIHRMEEHQGLDRDLESLPSDEGFAERRQSGSNLTRPEFAVILSYAKNHLKERIPAMDFLQDTVVLKLAKTAFPERLMEMFGDSLIEHPLYRNIAATQVANDLVNHMGCSFVNHLQEFGRALQDVVRAWIIIRESFEMETMWEMVESLRDDISSAVQMDMWMELIRLGRRATRWLLRHRPGPLDCDTQIAFFRPGVSTLRREWQRIPGNIYADQHRDLMQKLIDQGVPQGTVEELVIIAGAADALTIIDIAVQSDHDLSLVAELFSEIGRQLELDVMVAQMYRLQLENHWHSMLLDTIYDEFVSAVALLCRALLQAAQQDLDARQRVSLWLQQLPDFLPNWRQICADRNRAAQPDIALYAMIQRRLVDLIERALPARLPRDKPGTGNISRDDKHEQRNDKIGI